MTNHTIYSYKLTYLYQERKDSTRSEPGDFQHSDDRVGRRADSATAQEIGFLGNLRGESKDTINPTYICYFQQP